MTFARIFEKLKTYNENFEMSFSLEPFKIRVYLKRLVMRKCVKEKLI